MNTQEITATLPEASTSNARFGKIERKEQTAAYIAAATDEDGKPCRIITVKFYMGRSRDASVVHCNVWISTGAGYSGYGYATGYGYHKESAALQSALDSAGINLSEPIDGRGDSACREALTAIMKAAGHSNTEVFYV